MSSQHKEFVRGMQEARAGIANFQARWPSAFPEKGHLVRPLAVGVLAEIAEAMQWSKAYTRAVLKVWKGRNVYCRAVLRDPHRYDLSGSVTEQLVDDQAREGARQQLAKNETTYKRRQQQQKAEAGGGEGLGARLPGG